MEELIPITMFMCIAAVAILRPLTKRLGGLLEVMTRERQAVRSSTDDQDLARLRVLMEHVSRRMDLVEERLDFTERLLGSTRQASSAINAPRPDPLRREREMEYSRQ
jgi:hypothetical protein